VKVLMTLCVVVLIGIAGCAKKSKAKNDVNPTVVDVTTPAPVYTAPQPVVTGTPTETTVTPAAPTGARTHTIKAGDTLYRLAIQYYGDGKQSKKIIDANPGLDPAKLKIGQTIVIP
jgi:nucleoid-associated protein YgaU